MKCRSQWDRARETVRELFFFALRICTLCVRSPPLLYIPTLALPHIHVAFRSPHPNLCRIMHGLSSSSMVFSTYNRRQAASRFSCP